MIWRILKAPELATFPHTVEVRSVTVSEFRGLDPLPETEKQDWILRHCARIDGLPVSPTSIDMHAGAAIIQGVLANPWTGQQPTASSDC